MGEKRGSEISVEKGKQTDLKSAIRLRKFKFPSDLSSGEINAHPKM